MSKLTNFLLSFIIFLLLINLAVSISVLNKQNIQPNVEKMVAEQLDSITAKHWGNQVAEMYNDQDHEMLYSLFSDQAKVKISHQQLQGQLEKLFLLFGKIEKSAFVSALKIGEKGDDIYFKLLFNIRIQESSKKFATLAISVVKTNNIVKLYGIKINATQALN
mgnify:CR=1 FL=1|tara:strand:- start:10922 stop:11410 length:489 start_codon:yes stop_codon:yes gene_type:complete